MAPQVGQEESKKAEAELNKVRKLPDNKRCANCLASGSPLLSAVVMPFKIFVCSNCKSAHQAFSHRCKSTQMSLWSMEEVRSLEDQHGGGNRAAQETYLAQVRDEERPREGDHLDVYKDFVKKAYLEQRWCGPPRRERSDPPPQPASRSNAAPRAAAPVTAPGGKAARPAAPPASVDLLSGFEPSKPTPSPAPAPAPAVSNGFDPNVGSGPTNDLGFDPFATPAAAPPPMPGNQTCAAPANQMPMQPANSAVPNMNAPSAGCSPGNSMGFQPSMGSSAGNAMAPSMSPMGCGACGASGMNMMNNNASGFGDFVNGGCSGSCGCGCGGCGPCTGCGGCCGGCGGGFGCGGCGSCGCAGFGGCSCGGCGCGGCGCGGCGCGGCGCGGCGCGGCGGNNGYCCSGCNGCNGCNGFGGCGCGGCGCGACNGCGFGCGGCNGCSPGNGGFNPSAANMGGSAPQAAPTLADLKQNLQHLYAS